MAEQVFGSCTHFQMRISDDQSKAGQTLFPKSTDMQLPKPLASVLGTLWRAVSLKSPLLGWLSHFPIHQYLLSSLKVKRICHAPSSFCSGLCKVTMNWGWTTSSTRGAPRTGQGHLQGFGLQLQQQWELHQYQGTSKVSSSACSVL